MTRVWISGPRPESGNGSGGADLCLACTIMGMRGMLANLTSYVTALERYASQQAPPEPEERAIRLDDAAPAEIPVGIAAPLADWRQHPPPTLDEGWVVWRSLQPAWYPPQPPLRVQPPPPLIEYLTSYADVGRSPWSRARVNARIFRQVSSARNISSALNAQHQTNPHPHVVIYGCERVTSLA